MNKWRLLSGLHFGKIIGARWRGEARQTENLPQLPVSHGSISSPSRHSVSSKFRHLVAASVSCENSLCSPP